MATESSEGTAEQLRLRERLARLRDLPLLRGVGVSGELARLQHQIDRIAEEPSADEVWRAVELARHQDRPYTLDYVERIFDDFIELHGDRGFGDDPATSVLDRGCRAHEVKNLYVVDGSFMPTSGGVPTTLTIAANSFRVAAGLVQRLKRGG